MDPTLRQFVLSELEIAYAVVDASFQVMEVGGKVALLADGATPWAGRSLIDLVPELAGMDLVLDDILKGNLPRLELSWVNRPGASGETRYLRLVVLPHRAGPGQISGLLYVVQDSTEGGRLKQELSQNHNELRLLQDRLAHQNLELEAANLELQNLSELKSQFVAVAAHELRTPLTAVLGFVEMLVGEFYGPLNERQHEALDLINTSSQRLLSITKDLLDVTRIETGRVELDLQTVDLPTLVSQVVAESWPQMEAKAQEIRVDALQELPQVLCDKVRASQIIGNLLSNAIKYTPNAGRIALGLTLAPEEGFVQLSVTDDGLGISGKDQDKLFRRFFRADSARRSESSGTGLGLHITRSLVELHGGRIWFESQVDRGSTFYVTLPIAA